MMTYEEAAKRIVGGRSYPGSFGVGQKLENHTYLVQVGEDSFGILLHETVVVHILSDNHYVLNRGQWITRTTMARISKYAPVEVHTVYRDWHVHPRNPQGSQRFIYYAFISGMVVNSDGIMVEPHGYFDLLERERAYCCPLCDHPLPGEPIRQASRPKAKRQLEV